MNQLLLGRREVAHHQLSRLPSTRLSDACLGPWPSPLGRVRDSICRVQSYTATASSFARCLPSGPLYTKACYIQQHDHGCARDHWLYWLRGSSYVLFSRHDALNHGPRTSLCLTTRIDKICSRDHRWRAASNWSFVNPLAVDITNVNDLSNRSQYSASSEWE